MKKILFIVFFLLLFSPWMALEEVCAEGMKVVQSASEYDYPPFCLISPEGQADGFSVELLREALKAVHLEVVFKTGQWDVLKNELREGLIEALPLVGRTPEREALYDFTFPYLTLHGAVFVRKGESRIQKVSDLADKTVAVLRGDNAEEFARRTSISSHILPLDTYVQAMEWLEQGKCDAVIAQRLMGLVLLNEMKMKTVAPLDFDLNEFEQNFCFAVRKGDGELLSKLNEGLSIVIVNGTFDRLHGKWFGPLLKQALTFKEVARYVLMIFVPVIVVLILVLIVLLRREVKRKTRILVQEIGERKQTEQLLRESEERYSVTLAAVNDGIWDWHVTSGKAYFSKLYYSLLDYENCAFPATYDAWRLLVHPEDLDRVENDLRKSVGSGEAFNIDLRMKTKSGEWRWVCTRGKTIEWDSEGKALRMVGTLSDITKRKKAEEENARLQAKLQQVDKMITLGTLVSGVAHEINNPNNFISLNISLFRKAWGSVLPLIEKYHKQDGIDMIENMDYGEFLQHLDQLIKGIAEGSQRIKKIVGALKDYVQAGTMDLSEIFDLNEIAKVSVDRMKEVINKNTLHFYLNLKQEPLWVRGNRQRIEQVILNLIQNACDALDSKDQSLSLTAESLAGTHVLLTIADQGRGIAKEDLPKIMDPFFTTKRDKGGTGLGLSISSSIVKDHGGKLSFQSEPGKGTTVTLLLKNVESVG